jgi:hypothetical protein
MEVLVRQRIDLTAPPHPLPKEGGRRSMPCCSPGPVSSPAIFWSVIRPFGVPRPGAWTASAVSGQTSLGGNCRHDGRGRKSRRARHTAAQYLWAAFDPVP